jgi:hypothetical protein
MLTVMEYYRSATMDYVARAPNVNIVMMASTTRVELVEQDILQKRKDRVHCQNKVIQIKSFL